MRRMAPYAEEEVTVRGRHRDPGLSRGARVAIVIMVLVAAGGGYAFWQNEDPSGCQGTIELSVSAAPEIATVLAQAGAHWAETAHGASGECVSVTVTAAAPADVALDLASRNSVSVPGLTVEGSAPPAAPGPTTAPGPTSTGSGSGAPDIWVADSSIWLARVRAVAPSLVPLDAESVASSPVVLAVPEPVAAAVLHWPDQQQNWSTILGLMTGGAAPKLGVVEPNRDAVGLTSLIALAGAAETLGPQAGAMRVAVAQALLHGRVPAEADLLAGFPKTEADIATSVIAAPLAERSLIAYNATAPAVRLAALYVQPLPAALDYPWAVMPGVGDDKTRLAGELRDALTGNEYVDALATVGLRGRDGTAGFEPMPGAPTTLHTSPPDVAVVSEAVGTWLSLTRPGRILAVVDISGSMNVRVASANNATRFQLLIGTARGGLNLFGDDWQVGLWTFSTNLTPTTDYLEILPIKPLTENRTGLEAAMDTLQPKPNGDTGLYDTVLAAYKRVQQDWDPNVVNSVVLMTDGQNDDDNSLTLEQLVSSLQTIVDPRYPIQMIIIGIGPEVSRTELESITNVTHGGVFIATDPAEIQDIFLEALSLRPPAAS